MSKNTMSFSAMFEEANKYLKKALFDREKLTWEELSELLLIIFLISRHCANFGDDDCFPEDCDFAAISKNDSDQGWISEFGYDNLCDLVWDLIDNNLARLEKSKDEILDTRMVFRIGWFQS